MAAALGKVFGLLGLTVVALCLASSHAFAQDEVINEYADPNVQWTVQSNVSACPAGDSVVAGHNRTVKIHVFYSGIAHIPKVGVPPDSIWVVAWAQSGTARPYDYSKPSGSDSAKVFADDSTSTFGRTTITITGLAGCGTIGLHLYVSGELKREGSVIVRTVDTNADGVVTTADESSPCDVNYSVFGSDAAIVEAHRDHSHRQALHGTVVRRTNACATCYAYSAGTLGGTELGWSPDGKRLSYTQFIGPEEDPYCAIFFVPSDPADGNTPVQISYPPDLQHDYDPQWTPAGDEIFFDRDEYATYRQVAVPNGQLTLITSYDNGGIPPRGDVYPAISPDGRWIAFCRHTASYGFNLYKIPIEGVPGGAVATQLTSITVGDDEYPQWSADGQWIYFQRWSGGSYMSPKMIMRIHPDGTGLDTVLAVAGKTAVGPGLSPDGEVLVVGGGDTTSVVTRVLMIDAVDQTSFAKAIPNFAEFESTSESEAGAYDLAPLLSPRFSPDGTRFTLRAAVPGYPSQRPQVWATRRNMSRPPVIASFGGQSFADSTPVVNLSVLETQPLSATVSASDPESDAITYKAYAVQTGLGYTIGSSSGVLAWTPSRSQGGYTYSVRLQAQTASGGCDYVLAQIAVTDTTKPGHVTDLEAEVIGGTEIWPIWTAPGEDAVDGQCTVYDLRYSTSTITSANFSSATQATGEPIPLGSGYTQGNFGITNLTPDTDYWFALKSKDPAGNWSLMSNVLQVKTMGGGGGFRARQVGEGREGDPSRRSEGGAASLVSGRPTLGGGRALVAEVQVNEGIPRWSLYFADTSETRTVFQNDSVDVLVQSSVGGGAWNTRRRINSSSGSGKLALGAARGPGRVLFLGDFQVLQAWSDVASRAGGTSAVLGVASAEHTGRGDVSSVIDSMGRYELGLSPGDTLTLEYESTSGTAPAQGWFLLVGPAGSSGEASLRRPRLGDRTLAPPAFALKQNQPNPFTGATAIHFSLPMETVVRLEIFDTQGRLVRTLTNGVFAAGFHSAEWDHRTEGGYEVRAGVYLYRIQAGSFRDQKKMVLLGR